VNQHTTSAGEMIAAFAKENNLATIVGTTTAGRLLSGTGTGTSNSRSPITSNFLDFFASL